MDYSWQLLVLIVLLIDYQSLSALYVTNISVPDVVDFRDNVTLSCNYHLSGHTLNSVKWYKDRHEFFRYSPLTHPVYMKFWVQGVQVLDGQHFCNESNCRVELRLQDSKSTGTYTCEVSGDAPLFKLGAREANMTVAVLPQSDPLIESFKSVYHLEDDLSPSCSSDYSSLPTKLSLYVNGEQPGFGELHPKFEPTLPAHDYILRKQSLLLHLRLQGQRFFHLGKMLEIKCVAEIENYPDLRRETTLSAELMQFDNLNNQMLIYSGTNVSAAERSCILTRTSLISVCFVIFLLTKCLHQLQS